MINNQSRCAEIKVISSEQFDKIQFVGKRSFDGSIKMWSDLSQLINSSHEGLLIEDEMYGEMNANEVSHLIEIIGDSNFYKSKKIAIVLKEDSSYNSRFFDIVAKYCGLCIKHFKMKKNAIEWLAEID